MGLEITVAINEVTATAWVTLGPEDDHTSVHDRVEQAACKLVEDILGGIYEQDIQGTTTTGA
jgi:hypothetical protein